MIPAPPSAASKRVTRYEKLTGEELRAFMNKHGLADKELAQVLGVTIQAIRLWLSGSRTVSITISRLIALFDKYPQLLTEF